jgi:hypothetical protein
MTQACCPSCRLRFSRVAALSLEACPRCAQPVHWIFNSQDALGYPLFDISDPSREMPAARAAALAILGDPRERS